MKIRGSSQTRLARNSQNKVYYRMYYWMGQQCVGSYVHILDESLHSVLRWSHDPLPSPLLLWPWYCKSKGCDNYCKTEDLTQSTWTNSPKYGGKLLWFHSYENNCKYNFHNNHVIIKIIKNFYYKYLELYSILFV